MAAIFEKIATGGQTYSCFSVQGMIDAGIQEAATNNSSCIDSIKLYAIIILSCVAGFLVCCCCCCCFFNCGGPSCLLACCCGRKKQDLSDEAKLFASLYLHRNAASEKTVPVKGETAEKPVGRAEEKTVERTEERTEKKSEKKLEKKR